MKRYECLTCGTKQKMQEKRIEYRARKGHMTNSMHGLCAKCKSIEPVISLGKD